MAMSYSQYKGTSGNRGSAMLKNGNDDEDEKKKKKKKKTYSDKVLERRMARLNGNGGY